MKKRRLVEVTCADCGEAREVRAEHPLPIRCADCSRKADAMRVRPKAPAPLCVCGAPKSGKKYGLCLRCRRGALKVFRECKGCSKAFSVSHSRVFSPKNNCSGNFCSRPCYESWLRVGPRANYGGAWQRARKEAVKRAPFCAICGTLRRLHVHHILPVRLNGGDHSQGNLIALCPKHHKLVELLTVEAITFGGDPADTLAPIAFMLRMRQGQTRAVLTKLYKEVACQTA